MGIHKKDHRDNSTLVPTSTYIGIDPGTRTGMAIVKDGIYIAVHTGDILDIFDKVMPYIGSCTILIENPNLRNYFGNTGREVLQGAGSIKRDFAIWETFIDRYCIPTIEVAPASIGRSFDNEVFFKKVTGWQGRTSKHARDAAKLVYRNTQ